MRLTVGKKIAVLILLLYPWFVLIGIIGILGIEATGRSSYEIIDQANFLFQLLDLRSNLSKTRNLFSQAQTQSVPAYLEITRQGAEQALNFLGERRFYLGETFSKERILKDLVSEMRHMDISKSAEKLDSFTLALDVLIKDTREEFRKKSITPFKTQALSIAGLAFSTLGVVIIGSFGVSWVTRGIKLPLRKIINITSTISELRGDLTRNLDIESQDEIGDLARAFNQMLQNLAVLMRHVRDIALKVVESSKRIKEISQLQAQISLRQSSQVQEAKNLMENLKDTAKHIAGNSRDVAASLGRNLKFTKDGREIAGQVVGGIERIRQRVDSVIERTDVLQEKSKSIDKILGWIEEISKKIDILAINFNIEASKSEDTADGVPLLAKEVRMLSERSQDATAEIREIISEIQSEIRNTSSVASGGIAEVMKDLGLITKIEEMTEKVNLVTEETERHATDITSTTQEQEKLSAQAASFISYIQELSKQSLLHSGEIETLSQQIDALSCQLKNAISEFRLD